MSSNRFNKSLLKTFFSKQNLKNSVSNREYLAMDLKIDFNVVESILNSNFENDETITKIDESVSANENVSQTENQPISKNIFMELDLQKKLEKLINLK